MTLQRPLLTLATSRTYTSILIGGQGMHIYPVLATLTNTLTLRNPPLSCLHCPMKCQGPHYDAGMNRSRDLVILGNTHSILL